MVFPLGFLLHRGLRRAFIGRWRPELAPQEITYVSHVFVIACLAHSVLIFFPNHVPPDLWNHLPQVEWLSELPLDFDSIYRYSTSSDPFDDGHVRPHFGVEYGAPYPPFFYVLTLAATKLHGDARFLIEFLSVLVIAAMTVPLFLLARTVFHDPRIAQLAVLLFVLEISAWHHAHGVHSPGTMGALLVLVWMVYLTAYHDSLYERAHLWIFAVLSATAALSYAASLVQLCIFAAVLLLLLWIGGPRSLTKRVVLGFGMGLLASFVFYYAPYALEAIRKSSLLLDRATYDPPATFFFLRNQMRDTVRILYNGYPLFVALSIGGWVLLCRAEVAGFHRRLLVTWGLTYVLMLLFKDPGRWTPGTRRTQMAKRKLPQKYNRFVMDVREIGDPATSPSQAEINAIVEANLRKQALAICGKAEKTKAKGGKLTADDKQTYDHFAQQYPHLVPERRAELQKRLERFIQPAEGIRVNGEGPSVEILKNLLLLLVQPTGQERDQEDLWRDKCAHRKHLSGSHLPLRKMTG